MSELLLVVTDMEGVPGAFWVSLGTIQTSAYTIIIVYLYPFLQSPHAYEYCIQNLMRFYIDLSNDVCMMNRL